MAQVNIIGNDVNTNMNILVKGTDEVMNISTGNVRYGNVAPAVLPTDKKNDTYIRTTTGLSSGIVQSQWVFDSTVWIKVNNISDVIVNVTGVTPLPLTLPLTTLPGVPVFTPNTPTDTDALYVMPNGQIVTYNGTQYIGYTSTTSITDNVNGTVTTTLGVGQVQDSIRPINELLSGTINNNNLETQIIIQKGINQHNKVGLIENVLIQNTNQIPNSNALTYLVSSQDGNYASAPIAPIGQFIGQKFIFKQNATLTATLAVTNTNLLAPISMSTGTVFTAVWDGSKWIQENNIGLNSGNVRSGVTNPLLEATDRENDTYRLLDSTGLLIDTYTLDNNAWTSNRSHITKVADTRTLNTQPQGYITGDHSELKETLAIQMNTIVPSVSIFAGVRTMRQYGVNADLTGGVVRQEATVDDGRAYYRLSTSATTWGNWILINSTSKTERTITQTAHGFTAGQWVRHNGTSYVLTNATTADGVEAPLFVSSITDVNNFVAISEGYVIGSGLTGLTPGHTYYLASTVAGGLTAAIPPSNILRAVFRAETATSGYVIQQPTTDLNGTQANIKSYRLFEKTATQTIATPADILFESSGIGQGSKITKAGNNFDFTITPTIGATECYRILFNAGYMIGVTSGILDIGLCSSTAQTINGTAIAANGQFGRGTSLFTVSATNAEVGTGIISYAIVTSVPITFKIRALGVAGSNTIFNASTNRMPTIEIQEV